MRYRTEHDSLGKKKVPSDMHYGIFTQRAHDNFQISGVKTPREFLHALAKIKIAAAEVNSSLGHLEKQKAKAIVKAAREVLSGKFDDNFVIDVFQAGAGTPVHMNMNEVLANRATELLGGRRGQYKVHPNDDVNFGQSSNDVIPTALRISSLWKMVDFLKELELLGKSLQKKSSEFRSVLKSGRTHLQDAVPMTLGQEFGAYAFALRKHYNGMHCLQAVLSNVHIGGTAIGTGINTDPRFRKRIITSLRKHTKLKLKATENYFEGTQSATDFALVSAGLRNLCVDLVRICNDLRLLSSGPRTGLNEIKLPAVEPGSSIMPGKVNPSEVEAVTMVCYHVMGLDHAIALGAQSGQLELNVMTPMIMHNLLSSLKMLTNSMKALRTKCVTGIKVNKDVCKYYFEGTLGLATALNPIIGYEKAASLAKEAARKQVSVLDLALDKEILSKKQVAELKRTITKPHVQK